MTARAAAGRVMSGIRVLEVAAWTYVPAAGAVLAEWGADVLKIEHPETGDPQRGLQSSGLVQATNSVNTMIELPNRGKRSVAIDLRSPAGRDVLLELAARSDVFLTNFLPDARRRLGIDVDNIRLANPDIIYVRGSAHGQRGPERDQGGYDGSSFWARSIAGIAASGEGGWPMRQPAAAFGDLIGGMTIAGGIAAALFHRERTKEATVVDNSLLGNAMWAAGAVLLSAGIEGSYVRPNPDRNAVVNPGVNTYRTLDGRFIMLMFLQSDRYWGEFTQVVGRADMQTDARFRSASARSQNRGECIAELDSLFASKTFDEWRKILGRIEGTWAPVLLPNEVIDDPQVDANGYLREITLEDGTAFEIVGGPIQFDEQPPELSRAPHHGEHTDEVLAELGYDEERLIELKISGAIL
jgi:crotonobetainyl-CoA:carnitine CoA-transferase CaiB-like acyl-CoA transferase